MEGKKFIKFGQHLIFDAYGCDYDKLNDMELCYDVLNHIAKLGGMRKFHEPYIVKAQGNLNREGRDPGGFSGILMIYESHISIHTFSKRGFLTVDVYSCKNFEANKIVRYLKSVYKPKKSEISNIDRGAKYPSENTHK